MLYFSLHYICLDNFSYKLRFSEKCFFPLSSVKTYKPSWISLKMHRHKAKKKKTKNKMFFWHHENTDDDGT